MIKIIANKYDMEIPDNPEMERKAADLWEGGLWKMFPEIDNIDDLACFTYYMEKCAREFMEIMAETIFSKEVSE